VIYIVLREKSLKYRTHIWRLQAESLYEARHGKLCLRMACMAGHSYSDCTLPAAGAHQQAPAGLSTGNCSARLL